MNRVRVAALLRELADEVEREDDEAPPAPKSKPRRARRPTLMRPDGEAPPAVAGQAARILRERGFR